MYIKCYIFLSFLNIPTLFYIIPVYNNYPHIISNVFISVIILLKLTINYTTDINVILFYIYNIISCSACSILFICETDEILNYDINIYTRYSSVMFCIIYVSYFILCCFECVKLNKVENVFKLK